MYRAFFAAADADEDWYELLFILGDDHSSAAGNRFMFQRIAKDLLRKEQLSRALTRPAHSQLAKTPRHIYKLPVVARTGEGFA